MRAFLKHQELWCTIEVPVDTDGNPVAIPESKQIKAHVTIEMACDDTILSTIEKKSTAKAAWEALKNAFEDGGYSRLVSLLMKLTTTKLQDCASVEEYIDAS